MKRKIIVNHKLSEKIDGKPRYTRTDIEAMVLFIAKAYGGQFTAEELKDKDTGVDAAGIVLEFQLIDMGIAEEMEKRMKEMEKNFQNGR